jgi:hypothetical protein
VSASSPAGVLSQRVNQVMRVPDLDGDASRIHRDLSWFEQRKTLRPAGEGENCISLHLSACVGVTSCERGNRAQVSKEKVRVQRRLLQMLICGLCAFAYLRLASGLRLASSVPPL